MSRLARVRRLVREFTGEAAWDDYLTACERDGVDLANAETSVLIQSFPPVTGSPFVLPGARGPSDPGYDPTVDGSVPALPPPEPAFESEMAALSWNFLMTLVATSSAPEGSEPADDQFDPLDPQRTGPGQDWGLLAKQGNGQQVKNAHVGCADHATLSAAGGAIRKVRPKHVVIGLKESDQLVDKGLGAGKSPIEAKRRHLEREIGLAPLFDSLLAEGP